MFFTASLVAFPAYAQDSITINVPSTVKNGDQLSITGTASTIDVVIRVFTPDGGLPFNDQQTVVNGAYAAKTITIPDVTKWPEGTYTIKVSGGTSEVTKAFTISNALTPTPTPTETPRSGGGSTNYTKPSTAPASSSTPTTSATPSPTASVIPSPSNTPDVSATPNPGSVLIEGVPFVDIPANIVGWAAQPIKELYRIGAIGGKTEKEFDPEGDITRAEFTKILVSALKLNTDKAKTFNDVPKDAWFSSYVGIAAGLGITNGVDSDKFDPNALITREQMCAMIYRAAAVAGIELTSEDADFADGDEISDWAKDAIKSLQASGIINGTGNGLFTPKGSASRAATAKVVFGIFTKLPKPANAE